MSETITTLEQVEMDWTGFFDYAKLVEEEIAEYAQIEVTPQLREGGVHAHKAWDFYFRYLQQTWQTSYDRELLAAAQEFAQPRILSLGCGYGGIELAIARQLQAKGMDYRLVGLDLNPGLFTQAIATAKAENLNIKFQAVDLNFLGLAAHSFDLVCAHASLHHMLNLEHLFAQVYQALVPEGKLIVLDIIGETQTLFWRENVEFALAVIEQMPAKYKQNLQSLPKYNPPALQVGMEGIRQAEVEEQICRYFIPERLFKYGAFMRLICTHPQIGAAIKPQVPEDRLYLESLCALDQAQIQSGNLRATEMMGVFTKKPDAPRYHNGASLLAVLRSQFEKLKRMG